MTHPTAARPSDPLTIYTDGAADPNPGTGGWGYVVLGLGAEPVERRGGEPDSTNNRMEMTAAIRAIEDVGSKRPIVIRTDSLYLLKGASSWMSGWKAKGWSKPGLKNVDLWKRLDELCSTADVRWEWVRGHGTSVHNRRADELASLAVREQRTAAARTR